jgi:electron transport complex protein RnfC
MPDHHLFHGGTHPREGKSMASGHGIQDLPLLERYVVPLHQHIGAPPEVVVKKNDTVLRGQPLTVAGGFVSATVHAPTSGTVKAVSECLTSAGRTMPAVELVSDGEDTPADDLVPMAEWENMTEDDLLERIRVCGVVGMGGAAFPTHVKLSPPPAKPIDTLILNGVECEPCLTADHRLMLERSALVLTGARIIARILRVKRLCVAVEANKPDAIAQLERDSAGTAIEVITLPVRYPQGAEKQLIYAATGRRVPTGGLPMDVGVVVQNVGTAAAVAEAVLHGDPLYARVTTVTGTPVVRPGNWQVRIGTPLAELLRYAGGVSSDPAKIIFGGPMMGTTVYSLDVPVQKNTSGILLLDRSEVTQFTSQACLRCGRCVDACPMDLMPGTLSTQIECERFELSEEWHAVDCIECGCCAYVCPASRPLVQHMRRAKAEIMARRKALKAK